MNSIKSLLILGFVFLASGITFLIVGLATHLTTFWALGPSFAALGVVFLAISKSRKNNHDSASSSSGSEA
jgi:membrane protein implicated in regulation of membrane protease activity